MDEIGIPVVDFGVYILRADDEVVYVGYSRRNIYGRIGEAYRKFHPTAISVVPCSTSSEASKLERRLIEKYRPVGNRNGYAITERRRHFFTDTEEFDIFLAYNDGLSQQDIADTLGVSQMSISRIITRQHRKLGSRNTH